MKNRKIVFVLAVAVMLCIIAGAGVYTLLAKQTETIYVFRADCPAGTQVTEADFIPMTVDATIVIAGASASAGSSYVTAGEFKEIIQSAGTLRWDVTSGAALMKNMMTTYSASKVELMKKPSSIAVTVPADYLSAATNELMTGSRVNVYAVYDTGSQTKLILQNVRVLTCPKTSDGLLVGVTLEVNHEESLKLIHAIGFAKKVYFGLVDEQGYQYTLEEEPAYDYSGFTTEAGTGQTEADTNSSDEQSDENLEDDIVPGVLPEADEEG